MAKTRFGVCVVCGKIFRRLARGNQICCSRICYKRRQKQRDNPDIMVPCSVCGTIFQKKNQALCCSAACFRKRKRLLEQQWRTKNPDRAKLNGNLYNGRVGPAKPPWLDYAELRPIYANRPKDKVVDHIVPLADPKLGFNYFEGLPVCGLHVPWNLQYITPSQNLTKRDKIQAQKSGFQPNWQNPRFRSR